MYSAHTGEGHYAHFHVHCLALNDRADGFGAKYRRCYDVSCSFLTVSEFSDFIVVFIFLPSVIWVRQLIDMTCPTQKYNTNVKTKGFRNGWKMFSPLRICVDCWTDCIIEMVNNETSLPFLGLLPGTRIEFIIR